LLLEAMTNNINTKLKIRKTKIEGIENAFLKENNHYPTFPTEAYNLLVN
jgi:hypothetical protein